MGFPVSLPMPGHFRHASTYLILLLHPAFEYRIVSRSTRINCIGGAAIWFLSLPGRPNPGQCNYRSLWHPSYFSSCFLSKTSWSSSRLSLFPVLSKNLKFREVNFPIFTCSSPGRPMGGHDQGFSFASYYTSVALAVPMDPYQYIGRREQLMILAFALSVSRSVLLEKAQQQSRSCLKLLMVNKKRMTAMLLFSIPSFNLSVQKMVLYSKKRRHYHVYMIVISFFIWVFPCVLSGLF